MSVKNGFFTETKLPARISGLRRDSKGPSASHDALFKSLFEKKDSVIVSSTPKAFAAIHPEDFTENFYISDEELEAYAQGFLDVCTEENIEEILLDQEVEDESLDNIALDDSDIKLSMYRSFKSIYDKWISNSKIGDSNGYFFNQYGQQDERTLFQHFNFVNRGAADIGGKAVIDIATLSDLTNTSGGKGPTESLYQLTGRILSKNNFDFFALPTYIQYSSFDTQPLADMFKAFPDKINEVTPSPTFLCVYIGGNSRTLDIPRSGCDKDNKISFQYKNDSFNISDPTQYPTDISDSGGLTAFKVRYGQEAQNHFTKIELDQQEFKETQESLLVIDALANPKKGGSPTQSGKGNNIYDMYLTRSYSCKVSALGNLQIQPLMYFQLDNVPMFKGTYMITNVTHKITPQKVETEFKGTRQPLVQTPIVVDPISLLDLALSEGTVEGERGNLSSFGGSDGEPGSIIVGDIDPNSLVPTKSLPPKDAPKLSEIINVMKKKKGVFNSKKLGNTYSNKPFSEVREKLITDGVYEPNKTYEVLDGEFEVNIVGIRSFSQQANTFDDFMCVFYVDPKGTESFDGKKWTYKAWVITTEPGSTALGGNSKLGANLIAEGQYIKAYRNRRHRASENINNYSILGNDFNILVYRDKDKDKWAEKDTKYLYVDTPGDNMHPSGPYDNAGKVINGWSAGCQVFKNPDDFAEFIYITYFIAQNEKSGSSTAKIRLKSKGGCGSCAGFLSDSIPDNLKTLMAEGTVVPKRYFNYTLLNSADFGIPQNISQGDSIYENYINSGFHAT